jgi:hypothetical protein
MAGSTQEVVMRTRPAAIHREGGLFAWLSRRLRSVVCGMSGHELLLHIEPGHLSLRCISCPYETPGWVLKESPTRPLADRRAAFIEQRAQ